MLNLAVIGGGGREHAIIPSLRKNPEIGTIYALPGNAGMKPEAEITGIPATDLDAIVDFCCEHHLDYVVVAPDDPLVLGCVDALEARGIPCFGPRKNAAILEGSKVFAKDFRMPFDVTSRKLRMRSPLSLTARCPP